MQAPYKELIWFENSAHSPPFEEPDKFNRLMIEKVLREKLPEKPVTTFGLECAS